MSISVPTLHLHVQSVWRYLSFVLLVVLSACTGLAEEPTIVTTLRPPELTAFAPIPTETPGAAVSTLVRTSPASNTSIAPQPTVTSTNTLSATPASTQATAAPATQDASTARGSVSGNVTNGTPGGTVPVNLAVMLHIMDDQGGENTVDTTIDASGNYIFKDVPIRTDLGYWVMATYTDRLFGSAHADGNPASPAINLPLKIYDVTTNRDVISINSVTTRINLAADGLQIAQIIRFTNKSDRVYTTDTSLDKNVYGSVTLTVPRGASILGFSDSEQRYSISEDGNFITDTKPVLPGDSHIIHIVYTLPYQDSIVIEQPVNYPVEGTVQLLVSPEAVSVKSEQLPLVGSQTLEGTSVKAYGSKVSMRSGDVLRYQIIGTVARASGVNAQGLFSRELIFGLLIGFGLGIVVLGLFLLVRKRMSGTDEAMETEYQEEIDDLIEQLATLDDQHTNGTIRHATYRRKRERLKLHLAKLMKE